MTKDERAFLHLALIHDFVQLLKNEQDQRIALTALIDDVADVFELWPVAMLSVMLLKEAHK